jgi:hypothetical protein
VETESKSQLNNVKEELAVLTDVDFTKRTDHVDSDQQEQPKPVSRRDDATDLEFVDRLSSNKIPRGNARRQMEPKDCVTSPLVLVCKASLLLDSSYYTL